MTFVIMCVVIRDDEQALVEWCLVLKFGDTLKKGVKMPSDALMAKIKQGFTVADLSSYIQSKVKPDARVYVLKKREWVVAGKFKLFLLDIGGDPESDWVEVLVAKYQNLTDGYVLAGGPFVVADWNKIPGTNLFFDVWYAGDGSGGISLVVEELEIEQTSLEGFLDVETNLSPIDLVRVAKAILDKRVDWDKNKTNLCGEGCSAEFVFEGRRYKYEEIIEIPTGLFLVK